MKFTRQSLYQLHCQNGLIHDQNGNPFDALRYSQFKYGLGNAAEMYAQEMADFLGFTHSYWFEENIFGITSSAFKAVPTASDSIANALLRFLEQKNAEKQQNCSIRKFKIHRNLLFESDYGNLSHAERQKLMQETDLEIENPNFWANRKIIVVDDIWITGSHENRIRQLFASTKVSEVLFIYVAEVQGSISPTIEHSLNHAWVQNLERLKPFFENPNCQLNARICKFLLSYANLSELKQFFEQLHFLQLEQICEAIKGDGYDQMPVYDANFQILLKALQDQKILV